MDLNIKTEGFIRTINNMGFMAETLDEFSCAFIKEASLSSTPSLDVGCAFGVATIPSILAGATIVANDICEEHLNILKNKISPDYQQNLILDSSRFPEEIFKRYGECFFQNILVSRVMHFLKGSDIEISFKIIFRLLKKGGKAFIINETPYLGNIKSFLPEYKRRVESGMEWPGEINNFKDYDLRKGHNLPDFMHLLDKNIMIKVAERNGFHVETCEYINRHYFPEDLHLDGRESIGLIAVKP